MPLCRQLTLTVPYCCFSCVLISTIHVIILPAVPACQLHVHVAVRCCAVQYHLETSLTLVGVMVGLFVCKAMKII